MIYYRIYILYVQRRGFLPFYNDHHVQELCPAKILYY